MYMMMNYTYGFFFFKQKTAYEMRISDWSSDVCSSDLNAERPWDSAGVAWLSQTLGKPRRAAAQQLPDGRERHGGIASVQGVGKVYRRRGRRGRRRPGPQGLHPVGKQCAQDGGPCTGAGRRQPTSTTPRAPPPPHLRL